MYLYYCIDQQSCNTSCLSPHTIVIWFSSSRVISSECRPRPYLTWRRRVTVSPAPNSYRNVRTGRRLYRFGQLTSATPMNKSSYPHFLTSQPRVTNLFTYEHDLHLHGHLTHLSSTKQTATMYTAMLARAIVGPAFSVTVCAITAPSRLDTSIDSIYEIERTI